MDFHLKTYKKLKIKHYFKTTHCFFLFNRILPNSENWIKKKQLLATYKLQHFQILNKLLIKILFSSIFKNLTVVIQGPIILLHLKKNSNLTIQNINSISPLINLLSIRLNNKIYSEKQLQKLKKLSYTENIRIFHNSIKNITQIPHSKFKKK